MACLTRRKFLASSAASALCRPRCSLARRKPGEKLNLAVIGVNDRGAANLAGVAHENIVALCDVDEEWSAKAREQFPKAAFFTDYRKMFDKVGKEIDAVVVSTPDHSHALPAALAMTLGKHVYCEKPLTPSVNETRVPPQARGREETRHADGHADPRRGELPPRRRDRSGRADRPGETRPCLEQQQAGGREADRRRSRSAKFDLDLWLGPNPTEFFEAAMNKSSWNFAWPHFHWRWWWEFGGGTLADLGCHYIDLPFWALGLTAPTSITATGKKTYTGDNTTPDVMQVDYQFPATKTNPGRPPDVVSRRRRAGSRWERDLQGVWFGGDVRRREGKAHLRLRQVPGCCRRSSRRASRRPRSRFHASIGHHKEWCEAIKNGGNDDVQLRLLGPPHRGGAARQRGLSRRQGDRRGTARRGPRAARTRMHFLGREYRKGWELPEARGGKDSRDQGVRVRCLQGVKESRSQGVRGRGVKESRARI